MRQTRSDSIVFFERKNLRLVLQPANWRRECRPSIVALEFSSRIGLRLLSTEEFPYSHFTEKLLPFHLAHSFDEKGSYGIGRGTPVLTHPFYAGGRGNAKGTMVAERGHGGGGGGARVSGAAWKFLHVALRGRECRGPSSGKERPPQDDKLLSGNAPPSR